MENTSEITSQAERHKANWIESKERYEQQVLYVLAVLRRYPDYVNVLDAEEQEQFLRYFKPDWTQVGTFVRYHDQMLQDDPNAAGNALWLLTKFCTLNRLLPPDNLLQPTIKPR